MHIAHVALWTRSLNAQVQFWETVFKAAVTNATSVKIVRGLNHTSLRWMTVRPSSS